MKQFGKRCPRIFCPHESFAYQKRSDAMVEHQLYIVSRVNAAFGDHQRAVGDTIQQ